MSPKRVIIVYCDGSYGIRDYPTAEVARYHAGIACEANPKASVRVDNHVLQEGQRIDVDE